MNRYLMRQPNGVRGVGGAVHYSREAAKVMALVLKYTERTQNGFN